MVDAANLARGFMPAEEPVPVPAEDETTIVIIQGDHEGVDTSEIKDGVLTVASPDGSVVVDFAPKQPDNDDDDDGAKHDANLASIIDTAEQGRIVSMLLQAIETDDQSRQEWLQTRAKGIDMLGFRLEDPKGDVGASSSPLEGMSTVRHPLLPEAVIRFQSNASAELLPPSGPAKVRNDAPATPPGADEAEPPDTPPGLDNDDLAESLEKDFNHYLTVIDKGYRADTDRMLFLVGFGGAGFKKAYHDPIRRMPIVRSVDAADLIVSNDANDIDDAGRVTHRILMRHSTLIRMQIAGAYRKIDGISTPTYTPNALDVKISSIQGFNTANPSRPEDQPHTIYETYVELDLKDFEHKDEDGNLTGLELPYKVTIEKDSQKLLEIRRNWREDDPQCLAKKVFVKYPFVPAFGFYEIGLLQILGNTNRALTAAWREMLDSGMFANFPGFLFAAGTGGRQNTNEFRIAPGSGVGINTGGKAIQDVVMRLPYNDVTTGLSSLVERVEAVAQRLGGTAEILAGEGRSDAPVGTTLALIEQATKMLAAVHIRLHSAQSEEFQILKELFAEDPEAFWRYNKKPAKQWRKEEFLAALQNCDIVPAADPNTPSHMHRIMKAVAMKQLQAMNPQLYDARKLDSRIMRMIGIGDPEALFAPPQPPGQDPAAGEQAVKMAELQFKAKMAEQERLDKMAEMQLESMEKKRDAAASAAEQVAESQDRAADRASRERVAAVREQTERMKALSSMAEKGIIPWTMAYAAIMGGAAHPAATPAPYNGVRAF